LHGSKIIYIGLRGLEIYALNHHLIDDAIEFEPLFVLSAIRPNQVFPLLGIFLDCPLLNLVLPVLIRDSVVEESDTEEALAVFTNRKS
jgi:hypothetical protein